MCMRVSLVLVHLEICVVFYSILQSDNDADQSKLSVIMQKRVCYCIIIDSDQLRLRSHSR